MVCNNQLLSDGLWLCAYLILRWPKSVNRIKSRQCFFVRVQEQRKRLLNYLSRNQCNKREKTELSSGLICHANKTWVQFDRFYYPRPFRLVFQLWRGCARHTHHPAMLQSSQKTQSGASCFEKRWKFDTHCTIRRTTQTGKKTPSTDHENQPA